MSKITRCPHCKTIFMVNETQINQRSGNVRCGICHEIFNSIDNVLGKTSSIQPKKQPIVQENLVPKQLDSSSEDLVHTTQETPLPQQLNPEAEEHFQQLLNSLDLSLDNTSTDEESLNNQTHQPTARTEPTFTQPPAIDNQTSSVALEPNHQTTSPETALTVARKKSRLGGILWGIGSLLLLCALVVQSIYFYSKEITTWWPPAQEIVDTTCEVLSCSSQQKSIKKPSIRIQVEGMTPVEGLLEHFTQKITITNTSDSLKKWPLLIQEIKDANEHVLARHTLKPEQYLPTSLIKTSGLGAGMSSKLLIRFEFAHNAAFTSQITLVNPSTSIE